MELAKWQTTDLVVTDIGSGDAIINDGVRDYGTAEGMAYFMGSDPRDPDTGGVQISPKWAPPGWLQQRFETEIKTSQLNSIHEKDYTNADIGWSSLKFYDVNGSELTTQGALDTDCVRTDLLWMPTVDCAIKGGYVAQMEVPSDNLYVWALGADIDAGYGIPPKVFLDGGLNMAYLDARWPIGMDGVSATVLYYTHAQLGSGKGTNRLRFIFRHPAGFKHRIQVVLEIFRP